MKKKLSLGVLTLLLAGCASPVVVQEKQVQDETLNCPQLLAAVGEAREFEKKARGERKATGTNVAAAIFFWPGLIATYSNTEDAINAAKERESHLMKLYSEKKCVANVNSVPTSSSSNPVEQRLAELKALYDKKLLNDDEYKAARKKALGL